MIIALIFSLIGYVAIVPVLIIVAAIYESQNRYK